VQYTDPRATRVSRRRGALFGMAQNEALLVHRSLMEVPCAGGRRQRCPRQAIAHQLGVSDPCEHRLSGDRDVLQDRGVQRVDLTPHHESDPEPVLAHGGKVGSNPPVPVGNRGGLIAVARSGRLDRGDEPTHLFGSTDGLSHRG